MYWNSKGHWKKPTKAGKSNEKPRQKTDEVMQRPVKPSKGVGKLRSEIVAKASPPVSVKSIEPVDPKPQAVEEPVIVEDVPVEVEEEIEEEVSEEEKSEAVVIDMSLSRKKLTEIAKSKDISVSKRMSKQDIIDAILGE